MQRRNFLKTGLAGLGATSLGPQVLAGTPPVEEKAAAPLYPSYGAFEKAYAGHVAPGHVKYLERLGATLVPGKTEGVRIQDAYTGKWYWDCHRVGSLYNLGHRHPEVIKALRAGFEQLEIGNAFYLSQYKAHAAQRLSATTDDALSGVVYAASGTEAVEVSIKAARGITRRRKIVSLQHAYHGHSIMTIAAGGELHAQERFLADYPEEFTHVPWNDYAALEKVVDDETAAVLLEPMPAAIGCPPPLPGYLKQVEKLCHERGALLILDEIVTGVGGTGTFWLYQQEDILPDILTTAKGIAGGMQANAAALMKPELFQWMADDALLPHYTTFGGNELGCVATVATCDVVTAPGFLDHVNELALHFSEGFASLPFGTTQRGLFIAFHLPAPRSVEFVRRLFENGVLVLGRTETIVLFRPPLITSFTEADAIIGLVQNVSRQMFPST